MSINPLTCCPSFAAACQGTLTTTQYILACHGGQKAGLVLKGHACSMAKLLRERMSKGRILSEED